jgi:hypothetical protein
VENLQIEIPFPQVERGTGLFEVIIDPGHIHLCKEKIGAAIGYGKKEIPEYFNDIMVDVLAKIAAMCEPKAGYRIFDIQKSNDCFNGFTIDNTFLTTQKIVLSQLKNVEKIALFVCTIGPKMENWRKQLEQDGKPDRGYCVDAIASAAVENTTDLLHDHIQLKMAQQSLNVTNRFSPGYCGWSVAEQQLLFSFLPKGFCGITLTESSLMEPIKSVSGIIGIGANVVRKQYFCGQCTRKDCAYGAYRRSIDTIN